MTDYCSQEDVEGYLNIDFTNNPDDTVSKWITAASAKIDSHCRRDFDQHTDDVESHDGKGKWGDLEWQRHKTVNLKNHPVISVGQVDEDGTVLVDGTNYEVYEDEAKIVLIPESNYFNKKRKSIAITYTWGYATVPLDVNDACIWLVAHEFFKMLKFSEGGVAQSISIEGESVSLPEVELNPVTILEQLNNYIRWGYA